MKATLLQLIENLIDLISQTAEAKSTIYNTENFSMAVYTNLNSVCIMRLALQVACWVYFHQVHSTLLFLGL